MNLQDHHPHLGRLIEDTLEERGMSKAEFARRIKTSRQNVSLILKKETLDTGLLWRIGQVLDTDFFHLLSVRLPHQVNSNELATVGRMEIRIEIGDKEIFHLTEEVGLTLVTRARKGNDRQMDH